MPPPQRAVDAIADRFVVQSAALDPGLATYLGVEGHDHLWADYSPDGHAERIGLVRRTIAALHAATPLDDRENVAKEAMLERLGLEVELFDAHITQSRVSVIAGATQDIRSVFDQMPVQGADAWANIASRLRTVDVALDQVRRTLAAEAADGNVSALRQLRGTVEQIETWTGERGDDDFFAGLLAAAPAALPASLHADLATAAGRARRAFAEFGDWLGTDLARSAPRLDAVGEQRYALNSRYFLGTGIDLAETYAWGWAELERIRAAQRAVAVTLTGRPDIDAAIAALDDDPARRIGSAEAFRDWMQGLADRAVADLHGSQFDIPAALRRIECKLAPTHDGSIYYTDPSEDFSRPGRMWWAVPQGIDTFSTWKETTTVYHEGVPGHHLQIGLAAVDPGLNRWQRKLAFVSGHGEGWALYAERLMDELGHLDDPGDQMGMLDAHAFRAARVVLDIGLHLQLVIPPNDVGFHPGERWTPDLALSFLLAVCATDEATLTFERDRYLGWPGQAASYKVGERVWLEARDDARRRHGDAFDLRRFHADALSLGSLGLDPLRTALARL